MLFELIKNILVLFGLGYMVFILPVQYAKGVSILSKQLTPWTVYVPILNIRYVEKQLEVIPMATITCIMMLINVITAIVMIKLENYSIFIYNYIVNIFLVVLYSVISMYQVFKLLRIVNYNSLGGCIIKAILFPMGQLYIGNYLYKYVRCERKVKSKKGGLTL